MRLHKDVVSGLFVSALYRYYMGDDQGAQFSVDLALKVHQSGLPALATVLGGQTRSSQKS